MVEDRIGYRYAKSIFSLAEEKNMLEDTKTDMECIATTVRASQDLDNLLKSPLVSMGKKLKIVNAIFDGKFDGELTPLLVDMIIRKGREEYLPNVASAFLELYDQFKGIRRGTITTAHALSQQQRLDILKILQEQTGKTTILEEKVDTELIGGFRLKVEGTLFDGSVSSSLRKIKQEFKKR